MLNKIFIFVFLFVLVNSQTTTVDVNAIIGSFPLTVQAVISRDTQLDVLTMYQTAFAAELQSAGLNATANIAAITATLQALVAGAQAQITQLTTQLTQFQTDAKTAFQVFTSQLASTNGTHDGFSSLIQLFGDARAALRLECEDLKNVTNVAIAAIKDLAVAKIQAGIAEQQTILQASTNFIQLATDPVARAALINKIIDLRAKGRIADQLVPLVTGFIATNQGAITQCLTAVQQQSVALTLGVKNTYDQVKASVNTDVQNFKNRMTVIVGQAVSDKQAFVQNIVTLIDDAKQQIRVDVSVAVADLSEATQDIVKKTVQAALEAITLGSVQISITVSSKRQASASASITVTGFVTGVSAFLQANGYTDLQSAFNAIQNDPSLQLSIANYQKLITPEQINATQALIASQIAAAQAFVQKAQADWQTQLALVISKAADAKAALANSALAVKDKVAKIWAARLAQIDAEYSELNATIENLKANIPQLQSELQEIQAELQPILAALPTAIGDALATLTAQKNALIEALTQKAAELLAAQKSAGDTVAANFAALVSQLNAEKAEITADIQTFAAGLKATAIDIHNHVKNYQDEIKTRIGELAHAIEDNIDNITVTLIQDVPSGVTLQFTVAYDDSNVTIDAVISTLTGVIQAEFTSDKVTVVVKANGKRNAQQVTIESNVASTDGSTDSSYSSAAALPVAAVAGIIAGVVIIIIIVVVVIVLVAKKKNDDDYQSMRA